MTEAVPPALAALENSISRTLEGAFGPSTNDYRRYQSAALLAHRSMVIVSDWSGRSGPTLSEYKSETASNIAQSIALLEGAIAALSEDLEEAGGQQPTEIKSAEVRRVEKHEVFVVHGHDGQAREAVSRFIEKLGLRAVVLHEQPNGGRTVIEKLERHSSVGFAVVLITPDDVGSAKGDELRPRARQNVILELGYFVGLLGRQNVCALTVGEVEMPSDVIGVVCEPIDVGGGWKLQLCKELRAAGFNFDMNNAL
ncbi:MAG: nucleotide-binding protein [Alphaproteobacteria bacterium]|nr:nucleotide-binding protein [Alphaproteobacteria bacterium]